MSTRWSSEGVGRWLLLDLGEERVLHSVRLAFYEGNTRKNYFKISLSLDNVCFEDVYQGESSGTTDQLERYDFNDKKARYVKIEFNGNSKSKWNSVLEARVGTSESVLGLLRNQNSLFCIITNSLQEGRLVILTEEGNHFQRLELSIIDMGGACHHQAFINTDNIIVINDLYLMKGMYICSVAFGKRRMSQLLVIA